MKLLQLYNEIKINKPSQIFKVLEIEDGEYEKNITYNSIFDRNKNHGYIDVDDPNNVRIDFYLEDDFEENFEDLENFLNYLNKYKVKFNLERDGNIFAWVRIDKKYFNL